MKRIVEPVLFASDETWVTKGLNGGIDTMIVDWEVKGKFERQRAWDTEINSDTERDVVRLKDRGVSNRWVRINAFGSWTGDEVETAIDSGATRILLPMVTGPDQVEGLLRRVDGRCEVGILVETSAAVNRAPDLGQLPLAGVYVGLNDLAIDRGLNTIFDSVADGTLDCVREHFDSIPFGFGGMTVLGLGTPIPFRFLLGELVRLRCSFSFCRRSFKKDMIGRDIREELLRIALEGKALRERTAAEVARDREQFLAAVRAMGEGMAV